MDDHQTRPPSPPTAQMQHQEKSKPQFQLFTFKQKHTTGHSDSTQQHSPVPVMKEKYIWLASNTVHLYSSDSEIVY
jgi:hypothetical protein